MEFLQARRGCKNPSPRRGRTTGPRIKMDGVRRMKQGGERRSVARGVEGVGGGGTRWRRGWAVACVIHTSLRHCYWLISLTISCDHRYIKHETGGLNACTPYHPCCHLTPLPCYVEMSIAFLICLLLPLWPLLYAFDEGLPKMCPFLPLLFLFWQTECGYSIKLYVCIVTLALLLLFS